MGYRIVVTTDAEEDLECFIKLCTAMYLQFRLGDC